MIPSLDLLKYSSDGWTMAILGEGPAKGKLPSSKGVIHQPEVEASREPPIVAELHLLLAFH